jgi:hypothetical protein
MLVRKLAASVALVTLLGLVQVGPAQAHRLRIKSRVEATYDFSSNTLTGSVESRPACEGNRTVRVYHINGATGQRTLTDTTKTDAGGNWEAHPNVVPTLGDQWLIVAKGKRLTSEHRCRAGRLIIPA